MPIKPFKENKIPAFVSSSDSFYSTGSSGGIGEVGSFDAVLSNKVQINLSFPVKQKTRMLGNSSSMYYFDVASGLWNAPAKASYDFTGPFSKLAFDTRDLIASNLVNIETGSAGSAYLEDKIGFDSHGVPVVSGNLDIRRGTANESQEVACQSMQEIFQTYPDSGYENFAPGGDYLLSTKAGGGIWGLGRNNRAQLSLGQTGSYQTDSVEISDESTNWTDVYAGLGHGYGKKSDGTIWGWGDSRTGQIGDGSSSNLYTFPRQEISKSEWKQVACANGFSIGIKKDGSLWSTGDNAYNQFGTEESYVGSKVFIRVGTDSDWKFVATQAGSVAAIKNNGTLWTWGNNASGQLGHNDYTPRTTPTQVGSETDWLFVDCGSGTMIMQQTGFMVGIRGASLSNGTMYAWGSNENYKLGINDTASDSIPAPQEVAGGHYWRSASCGQNHVIAIRNDGTLWAWGSDWVGQCGTGSSLYYSTPTQIDTSTNWKVVSAGVNYSLALKGSTNNAKLYAFGDNSTGQLGIKAAWADSSDKYVLTPTLVAEEMSWKAISAGGINIASFSVAIASDGTLWGWGINNNGQTGGYASAQLFSPHVMKKISSETTWSSLATGIANCFAIKSDGSLFGWGSNENGEMSLATKDYTTIPAQINEENDWDEVYPGNVNTFALKNDGSLWHTGRDNNIKGSGNDSSLSQRTTFARAGVKDEWSMVATSAGHTVGIRNDGTLWAWGHNTYGQLGTGDNRDSTKPVKINFALLGGDTWDFVSLGKQHTLALTTKGYLYAWGRNVTGQLGVGDKNDRNTPVLIGNGFKAVSAGQIHSAGIKTNGSLWVWGAGSFNGYSLSDITAPTQITSVGHVYEWTSVTCGGLGTIAINRSYLLYSWGWNTMGELLHNNIGALDEYPVFRFNSGDWKKFTLSSDIDFGSSSVNAFTVGLKNDGTLWSVGSNAAGQLGLGDTLSRATLTQIGSDNDWQDINSGFSHVIALKKDGAIWAWGRNVVGQLGTGDNVDRNRPAQIGNENNWQKLCDISYSSFSHFIKNVRCQSTLWGAGGGGNENINFFTSPSTNYTGYQYGDGENVVKNYLSLCAGIPAWSKIGFGKNSKHVLGISKNKKLYAWCEYTPTGTNNGQLGSGSSNNAYEPQEVINNEISTTSYKTAIFNNAGWIDCATSLSSSIAVKDNGTIWTWGNNSKGQLGDGTLTSKNHPVQVGPYQDWIKVSGGTSHVIGLRSDGTIWVWGQNTWGQLGRPNMLGGDTQYSLKPVQVMSSQGNNWIDVAAGHRHNLAIKSDGTLWAWGDGSSGQRGTGTAVSSGTPMQVGTDKHWAAVAAGLNFSIGLTTSGTIYTWGNNQVGQLGLGDYDNRNTPQKVGSDTDWTFITAGSEHVIALKASGAAYAWGRNHRKQLGLLSPTYSSIYSDGTKSISQPSLISKVSDWVAVAASSSGSAGLRVDGSIYFWGYNSNGQGGVASISSDIAEPTQIGSSTDWSSIHLNSVGSHVLSRKTSGELYAWGWNTHGQVGNGTSSLNVSTPINVNDAANVTDIGGTRWVSASLGSSSSYAIMSDGTLWGWGYNGEGELGDGTRNLKNIPKLIGASSDWVSVSSGDNHVLAMKNDGTLWAWGHNASGQLGDGSLTRKCLPVLVTGSWGEFKAAGNSSYAKSNVGTLYAWGSNAYGQLGDGTTISKSSPKQVGISYFKLNKNNKSELLTKDFPKSTQRNEDYDALPSQCFKLPITKPFLIEKIILEIPFCMGKSWFSDKTITTLVTSSYAGRTYSGNSFGDKFGSDFIGSFFDEGGPAITVSLMSQKPYKDSKIRDLITQGVITHKTDLSSSVVFDLQGPLTTNAYGSSTRSYAARIMSAGAIQEESYYTCVSASIAGNYTGSIQIQLTPQINNTVKTIYKQKIKSKIDPYLPDYLKESLRLGLDLSVLLSTEYMSESSLSRFSQYNAGKQFVAGIDVFGRGMTGFEPSGGSIFGGEYVTSAEGLLARNPFYVSDKESRDSIINYYNQISGSLDACDAICTLLYQANKSSPYLVKPDEKFILTMSKTRPALKNYRVNFVDDDKIAKGMGNFISSSYMMQIPNSQGHDVQLNTGSINITFYGSYVGAGGALLP